MPWERLSTPKENMKKNLPKISLPKRKRKQPEVPTERITTDTLAEHRERVLAGGRRFKYPVQYARHKLVINAIIISLAALIVLVTLGWALLYPAQNTSDFIYRVARATSLPVAKVDGQTVLYSDYLMRYRSSIQYLSERDQINLSTEDGRQHAESVKRRELDGAIADAYAVKLAGEMNITVTDDELEQFLIEQRTSSDAEVSEATYNAVILDYYGWSPEEYRHAMKAKLLRQKVSYKLDTKATALVEAITTLKSGGQTDLSAIAAKLNGDTSDSIQYSAPIWVPKDNHDGGLATAAVALKKGAISGPVKTSKGAGYYFIKLVDSNAAQVQYELLYIPLTMFDASLAKVKENNGIKEYISIKLPEGQ